MKNRGFIASALFAMVCGTAAAQTTMYGVTGAEYSSPLGGFMVIDQTTGAGATLGIPMGGLGITGVATDSLGRVFASTGSADIAPDGPRLIQINPATGALIADVGRLQTLAGNDCYIGDLSFQPGTDVLFGVAGNQGSGLRCDQSVSPGGFLVTVNTSTARVTVVGRDPTLGNANGGLAFAPSGTLYFTPCWSNPGSILTLNPATAAIISTVALQGGACFMGLAVRPSDGTIFSSSDQENNVNGIFIINPVTGTWIQLGSASGYFVHDLTFASPVSASIPTLSEWALVGLAMLVALIGLARVRRKPG